jgi:hypothetical protein
MESVITPRKMMGAAIIGRVALGIAGLTAAAGLLRRSQR